MARRKRGHAEGPHENDERWLLTYSDLITLLFVLFVVMYAISTTDVRKFVALAQSVSAAFNADVMTGQQPITMRAQILRMRPMDDGRSEIAAEVTALESDDWARLERLLAS